MKITSDRLLEVLEPIQMNDGIDMGHSVTHEAEFCFDESKGIEVFRYRINQDTLKIEPPEKVLVLFYNYKYSSLYRLQEFFYFFKKGKRKKWLAKAYPLKIYRNSDILYETEDECKRAFINDLKKLYSDTEEEKRLSQKKYENRLKSLNEIISLF